MVLEYPRWMLGNVVLPLENGSFQRGSRSTTEETGEPKHLPHSSGLASHSAHSETRLVGWPKALEDIEDQRDCKVAATAVH